MLREIYCKGIIDYMSSDRNAHVNQLKFESQVMKTLSTGWGWEAALLRKELEQINDPCPTWQNTKTCKRMLEETPHRLLIHPWAADPFVELLYVSSGHIAAPGVSVLKVSFPNS
jgi:hypothetical protein